MLEHTMLYTDNEAGREALAAAEAAERDAVLSREFLDALIQLRDEEDTAAFLEGQPVTGRVLSGSYLHTMPEHTDYRDEGCELAPACLTCPLPRCRYDEPGAQRIANRIERNRSIVALVGEGKTADYVATTFGIARRTVFRVLAEARS